jgi:hypothetical protein
MLWEGMSVCHDEELEAIGVDRHGRCHEGLL